MRKNQMVIKAGEKNFCHQNIKMAFVIAFFSLLFIACKKEPAFKASTNQQDKTAQETAATDAITGITYSSCGMKVNVFTPFENSANVYSFAYTVNGQLKRFAIGKYGSMDFTTYDKFSFEFAGYLDKAGTVKSWRIRRTDGKYLTTGLTYSDKITGSNAIQQIFLLSSLGNSQYKLLLPKLPVCNLAAIWYQIDEGYKIVNFAYNDFHLLDKDTKVTMKVVPLVIK